MAHNPIIIHIVWVIVGKPTLMLVDVNNTHNLMFEIFVTNMGHPVGTMDPSRILLPTGQIHNTIFFMKDALVKFPRLETYIYFQVWLGNVYDVILSM